MFNSFELAVMLIYTAAQAAGLERATGVRSMAPDLSRGIAKAPWLRRASTAPRTRAPDEFAVLLGTAALALVLDVESTKYAQQDPEAAEVNSWIYGERPSRSRMYAVAVPVTLAFAAFAGHLKRTYPAGAKNESAWRIPLWGLALGHGVAAAANFFNFRKSNAGSK